jgi:hypothetical protein
MFLLVSKHEINYLLRAFTEHFQNSLEMLFGKNCKCQVQHIFKGIPDTRDTNLSFYDNTNFVVK